MNTSNGIKRLVHGCIDDERTLRLESGFVRSSERRILLERLATERASFAQQLKRLDSARHWPARASMSWIELLRELRRALRCAIGGRNDGDAIAGCRRSRNRIEGLYDRAIALAWADERVLPVLLDQHARIGVERADLIAVQF